MVFDHYQRRAGSSPLTVARLARTFAAFILGLAIGPGRSALRRELTPAPPVLVDLGLPPPPPGVVALGPLPMTDAVSMRIKLPGIATLVPDMPRRLEVMGGRR